MKNSTRKKDIDALISTIQTEYRNIETLYSSSLRKKEINSDLKIKVKNYLENARSILDYCAHDIADACDISAQNIYFPIVAKDKDRTSFNGAINRNLPMLDQKNKNIFDYLESIQPYHQDSHWLADFATVTIDNKHSQLTPQTWTETERITSTHLSGGQVSWNPSAVKFGPGVWINGAFVNPATQMPVSTPETTVTKEIWVDFKFNDSISALSLLNKLKDRIPDIIDRIYKFL